METRSTGELDIPGARKGPETPLVVVGCDFRVASSSFRERLITTPEQRAELFAAIRRTDEEAGFLALETCNRVEWIVSTENPRWIGELLEAQMLSRWSEHLASDGLLPRVNVFLGRDAAAHLFRLVSGMESLAAGEAEIAGQFHRALQRAQAEQTTSRILNSLGRLTGGIAKTALRLGYRSHHARGIHVLTAWFLEERLGDAVQERTVVVAGMGEIGRKAADTLEQSVGCRVVRVNRTVAPRHADAWRPLSALTALLADADGLVVATGAQRAVLGPEVFQGRRAGRPLVVVDIGIPQQVTAEARGLPGVLYHNVDSLVGVGRGQEPDERRDRIEDAVEQQVARFHRLCQERQVVRLLQRAQETRLQMIQHTVADTIRSRLGETLDPGQQAQVEDVMKDLVREFAANVFDSVHTALDERWSGQ